MTTYRERREAKADRLDEWAEGREAKATGAFEASHDATAGIPFGQPILVGHHSERRHRAAVERGQRQASAGVEHANKASEMSSRAANIRAQNDRAIYSDDPDAIERLREKLAGLEAERDRIKAYNASCRKAAKTGGTGDLSLLDEKQRADIATTARVCAYQLRAGGAFPAYATSNLGGTITTTRKRIEQLEREAANGGPADRIITARYKGECADCGATIEKGQTIRYTRAAGARCAPACAES